MLWESLQYCPLWFDMGTVHDWKWKDEVCWIFPVGSWEISVIFRPGMTSCDTFSKELFPFFTFIRLIFVFVWTCSCACVVVSYGSILVNTVLWKTEEKSKIIIITMACLYKRLVLVNNWSVMLHRPLMCSYNLCDKRLIDKTLRWYFYVFETENNEL